MWLEVWTYMPCNLRKPSYCTVTYLYEFFYTTYGGRNRSTIIGCWYLYRLVLKRQLCASVFDMFLWLFEAPVETVHPCFYTHSKLFSHFVCVCVCVCTSVCERVHAFDRSWGIKVKVCWCVVIPDRVTVALPMFSKVIVISASMEGFCMRSVQWNDSDLSNGSFPNWKFKRNIEILPPYITKSDNLLTE